MSDLREQLADLALWDVAEAIEARFLVSTPTQETMNPEG